MTSLRDEVAGQLEQLHALGEPLGTDSPLLTHAQHGRFVTALGTWVYSPARLKFHEELMEQFLADQTDVGTDGRYAVVTAGAPGAGKSTALDNLGFKNAGWRRIDADVFKSKLVETLVVEPAYSNVLSTELADGKTVQPMELAVLVHQESVLLADQVRATCLEQGENIVIEGTLSWEFLPDVLINELHDAGYASVDVVLADPGLQVAQERALQRWWTGRTSGHPLGGRFTSSATINGMYLPDGTSRCAMNADRMVELGQDAGLEQVTLTVAS